MRKTAPGVHVAPDAVAASLASCHCATCGEWLETDRLGRVVCSCGTGRVESPVTTATPFRALSRGGRPSNPARKEAIHAAILTNPNDADVAQAFGLKTGTIKWYRRHFGSPL